jgi:hypothetical protein
MFTILVWSFYFLFIIVRVDFICLFFSLFFSFSALSAYSVVIPVPNTLEEEEINNVYVILRSVCANQIESEEERLTKVEGKDSAMLATPSKPVPSKDSRSSSFSGQSLDSMSQSM